MYVSYVECFEANSEIMSALIKKRNKSVEFRMCSLYLHGKSDSACWLTVITIYTLLRLLCGMHFVCLFVFVLSNQ